MRRAGTSRQTPILTQASADKRPLPPSRGTDETTKRGVTFQASPAFVWHLVVCFNGRRSRAERRQGSRTTATPSLFLSWKETKKKKNESRKNANEKNTDRPFRHIFIADSSFSFRAELTSATRMPLRGVPLPESRNSIVETLGRKTKRSN